MPKGNMNEELKEVDTRLVALASPETMTSSLQNIKVMKHDANELERKLREEFFKSWEEVFVVTKVGKIPFEKTDTFLKDTQEANKGLTDEIKQKMKAICTGKSKENFVDWTSKKPDNSGARYGIAAFKRYPDEKCFDCIHVVFKMDFIIAPKEKESSWKFWKRKDAPELENPLERISDEDFQNFFRLKTLEECYKEGVIEKINYVKPEETMDGIEETSTPPGSPLNKDLESGPESPKKIKN